MRLRLLLFLSSWLGESAIETDLTTWVAFGGRLVLPVAVHAAAVAIVHFLYHRPECEADKEDTSLSVRRNIMLHSLVFLLGYRLYTSLWDWA